MADQNKNPDPNNMNNNNPNSKKPKKISLPFLLAILILVGLVAFFIFKGINFKKYTIRESYDIGEFKVTETETGQIEYSGKTYELLKDHPEGDKFGNVNQVTSQYVAEGKYYYIEALVETRNEKNPSTYTQALYTAKIDEIVYDDFFRFLSENKAGSVYTRVVATQQNNNWIFTLLLILGAVVIGGLLIRSFSKNMGSMLGGKGGLFDAGSSRAKKAIHSKVRFTDVAGCEEVKNELVEIVDYFTNSKKYTELGAKLPKGVLLVGPPGTGKTLLAKAVAGEANVPFYSISGSDFVEMYVGVGASRVRDMFKTAKENSPCLVFIDEIDAVGRQRGAGLGGGNDEREQTLNQLLVEMDGFEDNSGVIIMAATNRSDVLDPALTRPGRFDRIITVDYPDKEGREAILKVHSRNKKLAKDVDFDAIAKNTVGFAGADLANIMNEAAILAVRANRDAITYKDIDEAIDRRIAGPAKSNKHLVEKERRQVAYHEAGHAIIGLKLPHSNKVQKITIVPRGRTGGHVLMTPEQDTYLTTKSELLATITGFLGGRSSEEIFFGDVSTGASNDFEQATNIARDMVVRYGMSNLGPVRYVSGDGNVFLGRDYGNMQKNYSDKVALEIDSEVRRIIEECHKKALEIIKENKDDVILLAETVYQRETINANEVEYLLEHRELPKVDEHRQDEYTPYDDYVAYNKNNVVLKSNRVFNKLYYYLDRALATSNFKLSCVLVACSSKSGAPISMDTLKEEGKKMNIKGSVCVLPVTLLDLDTSSCTPEEIKKHVEEYTSTRVEIVYGEDSSVKLIESKIQSRTSTERERENIIKQMFSNINNNDTNSDSTSNSLSNSSLTNSTEDLGFVKQNKEEKKDDSNSQEKSETISDIDNTNTIPNKSDSDVTSIKQEEKTPDSNKSSSTKKTTRSTTKSSSSKKKDDNSSK